jgi:hypothetical protein
MKLLQVVRILLLLLVAVSLGSWARRAFFLDPPAAQAKTSRLPEQGVAVVNFHGTLRCASCLQIGELAERVVSTEFAAERDAGGLTFCSIDFDQPGNQHYRDDYDLSFSTVVIVRRAEGKDVGWNRLDDVWSLSEDEAAFGTYVRAAIVEAMAAR